MRDSCIGKASCHRDRWMDKSLPAGLELSVSHTLRFPILLASRLKTRLNCFRYNKQEALYVLDAIDRKAIYSFAFTGRIPAVVIVPGQL